MKMIFKLILVAFLLFNWNTLWAKKSANENLINYDIIWTSQSLDATGSMPIGGGNLGLDVWVENGELLFYIGSPDAFDEKGNIIKLGRIRIKTNPNIFYKDFQQKLVFHDGYIKFKGRMEDGSLTNVRLWVDAYKPVIHIEFDGSEPIDYIVSFETWPAESPRYQSVFIPNGLEWYYQLDHNLYSQTRLNVIRQCGMEGLETKVSDPGRNLIMGGRIIVQGMVPAGETSGTYMSTTYKGWALKSSAKTKKLDLTVLIRIEQDDSYSEWQKALDKFEKSSLQTIKSDFKRTTEWWNQFHKRTYINLNPDLNKLSGEKDTAWLVGRNYQLFRYMLGCNSTGKFPTLFNGGFFNVDVPVQSDQIPNQSPDARLWGGTGFMAQNQRLLYWPSLRSGDYDVLKVGLEFYKDRAEAQRARAEKCFGVEGTPFPESVNWCGLFSDGLGAKSGHSSAKHLEYHYTSTLDIAYLMLEYARFSGNDIRPYLPVVEGIISYYDQFYRKENKTRTGHELDQAGKLVIYPSCAVEFAQGAKNNTDVLAGLNAISEGLLALPNGILSQEKIEYYQKFHATIPAFPTSTEDGNKYLAIAESFESNSTWQNMEFPQMYSVFPFHRYGIGLPDLEVAKNTWKYGWFNRTYQDDYICWYQNGIFTARMGMSDSAKIYTINKFLHSGAPPRLLYKQWPSPCYPMRFPTFYNTYSFDHAPDMDHGGSAMIGLQEMLIQTPGGKILLFPAWPKEWDVDFKMKAPYNTTVEGKFRNGKLNSLKVVPESRKKDLIICN